MQLIPNNSIPEENNTRIISENDYDPEAIFPHDLTSPSFDFTAESLLLSDQNLNQSPHLAVKKTLVNYSDSDSDNTYTLMDLDSQNEMPAVNEFLNIDTTLMHQTLGDAQYETQPQPQPSTSSQSYQAEHQVLSQDFTDIDSEDSWKPPSSCSDLDEERLQQIEEETCVGKRGYKKKKPLPKRLLNKKNRRAAVGKYVKPNPCMNKRCGNSCADKFSEEDRLDIFENYWGMGCDKRQKDFLLSCTKAKPIARKRSTSNIRNVSYDYFLNFQGENVKVCQQFLLKTLDISQMTLRYTVENANITINTAQKDRRTPHPHNKSNDEQLAHLKSFIEMLPAVPSHYCRNKSTKLYLPQEFENIKNLYKLYVDHLKQNNLDSLVLSKRVFRSIFKNDYNLGFHLPKKDKCVFCEKYKNLEPESRIALEQTTEYKNHVLDKDKCKQLFLEDQKTSKTPGSPTLCVSFDLEKVLNTPHGKAVTLYYSRKYAFYNESIYESGTRAGYCYVWGECQGKRGCNEIVTVIFQYLNCLDSKGTHTTINLYADSCAGQNRNRPMIAMIIHFLKTSKTIREIKVTYLLPGHTMMPVDSVHSAVENFIRNKTVWAPSEWPTMITNARSDPTGYVVKVLRYSDFLDWKSFSQVLLPTKFKIAFKSLRIVYFQKHNPIITFQNGFFEDSEKHEINIDLIIRSRANAASVFNGPAQLYHKELTISAAKYKDLVDLCKKNIIPSRYHEEYFNMGHDGATPDVLAESDADDTDSEN